MSKKRLNKWLIWNNYLLLVFGIISILLFNSCSKTPKERPNILMIVIDDMNYVFDYQESLKIPNLAKLAGKSTLFSSAYCSSPRCQPSRASFLLGLLPSTTGTYYHTIPANHDSLKHLNSYTTLHESFKMQGYTTGIYGKIFHGGKVPDTNYTEGYFTPHKGFWDDFNEVEVAGFKDFRYVGGGNFAWGGLPDDVKGIDDYNVDQAILALEESHENPFFLSVGLVRPHLPWIVPKRFFDLYPMDQIELPSGFMKNDLEDVPDAAAWFSRKIPGSTLGDKILHEEILSKDSWKEAIQAYYASISYADYQVGRLLDVLDKSQYSDNTIVMLFSDHGYHIGEKEHWTKFSLWEKTNRVPFVISLPGKSESKVSTSPVSLLDVYPTLISLAGLDPPGTHTLEGVDISALIDDPDRERGRPVISTYGYQCHTIRDIKFRYIRYQDGTEELYNIKEDPYEFNNLAKDPNYEDRKEMLKKQLPVRNINYELSGGALGWEQYFDQKNHK